jgi:hypothetical protein
MCDLGLGNDLMHAADQHADAGFNVLQGFFVGRHVFLRCECRIGPYRPVRVNRYFGPKRENPPLFPLIFRSVSGAGAK